VKFTPLTLSLSAVLLLGLTCSAQSSHQAPVGMRHAPFFKEAESFWIIGRNLRLATGRREASTKALSGVTGNYGAELQRSYKKNRSDSNIT
jgi:hypothetical protein